MRSAAELAQRIEAIDGRGYKAYRDLEGAWAFQEFVLFVDRVQSDPFAAPSKMRVRVARARLPILDFAPSVDASRIRRIAGASFLARAFREAIRSVSPRRSGTGKGGLVTIDAGGQEVLERTAVVIRPDFAEARIEIGLPANGRRVRGRDAAELLLEALPEIVARAWIEGETRAARRPSEVDDSVESARARCRAFVNQVENQEAVRDRLEAHGLIAFVGDGARLPRVSGASDRPMPAEQTRPFRSPAALRVSFEVPHAEGGDASGIWQGMGVPKGVVLLVGGGYHGKSTLLRAIERSVVPHIPGDGRERVVSARSLVKIRAEDGRSVTRVDVSGFIDGLPILPNQTGPRDTRDFSSPDASGSTSQAANIVEAIEAGATGLLLDEDTSATNLMVRDARMQALIARENEPITPYVERVRELYERFGISSLLVMGASGDYFESADLVLALENYAVSDVTEAARALVESSGAPKSPLAGSRAARISTEPLPFERPRARIPDARSLDARRGKREVKFSSRACEEIVYGTDEIDLRAVEQLFDPSQTRAIAAALYLAARDFMGPERSLSEVLDALEAFLDEEGLDRLDPYQRGARRDEGNGPQHPGAFARPRRFEIAAALNRLRTLRVEQV